MNAVTCRLRNSQKVIMGSKSSKKRSGTKPFTPKKEKKRAGKNTPHNIGSTQSLNLDSFKSVSFSPKPNHYWQPEPSQTLSRYESSIDVTDHAPPCLPSRSYPPPVPILKVENRSKNAADNKRTPQKRHSAGDEDEYLKENTGRNPYDLPGSNSKPKMRANGNYEAKDECDISFKKGDIMQLINDKISNDWLFVRNLTTQQEGYVPVDSVTVIESVGIDSQRCFFELDRDEAEEKLLGPRIKLGTYLLRPSSDDYALSLRCQNIYGELEIRHYKIRVVDNGICYIEADTNSKPFGNIVELIKYYTEKPGLRCKLKEPLSQDVPVDPLKDLAIKVSDLKIGQQIGSGNFGTVFAGTLHNSIQVAVKSLKAGGSMTIEEFRVEAETMHKLRHPNLVSLLAICEDKDKVYIITERMSNGALLTLLRNDNDNTIEFTDLMNMAIQVSVGMSHLEKEAFVHRDLRAANVLVGDGNIAKIADFGLARLLDRYYEHEDYYKAKKGDVSPYKWTAPEAVKQMKFTVKSDVWSFGILLYEMVTYGDEPYAAMGNHEAIEWLEKGNRLNRPTDRHCPLALYNIMKQCWLKNSNERPTFDYIRENLIEIKMKK